MKKLLHPIILAAAGILWSSSVFGQSLTILPTSQASGIIAGDVVTVAQSSDSEQYSINFSLEETATGALTDLGTTYSSNSDVVFGRGTIKWAPPKSGLFAVRAIATVSGKKLTSAPFFVQVSSESAIQIITPKVNVVSGRTVTVSAKFSGALFRNGGNPQLFLKYSDGTVSSPHNAPINAAAQSVVEITASATGSAVVGVTAYAGKFTYTVYGDDPQPQPVAPARLINIATRGNLESASGTLVGGFVISGGAKRVLVRAVGPTLGSFGITGFLPNPKLTLFNGKSEIVAENDDWNTDAVQKAVLSAAFVSAGAFALPTSGSLDSAIVANLAPGNYTAVVSSAVSGQTGSVLIEAYELPNP